MYLSCFMSKNKKYILVTAILPFSHKTDEEAMCESQSACLFFLNRHTSIVMESAACIMDPLPPG